MNYPEFFETIEPIRVQDPLSNILGVFEMGVYEFSYLDVVKSAGHSCPTVAGAYLITAEALKRLYSDKLPVRGDIRVEFKENVEDGVAGVIGNVISQITGATDKSGFKGLNGKFARHSLMHFGSDINSSCRFTRVDNNRSVDLFYDPSSVNPADGFDELKKKVISGLAKESEIKEFGDLWQDRVKRIFENRERVVRVEEV